MKLRLLLLLAFSAPSLAAPPGETIDTQLQACKLQANSTLDNAQCYRSATQQWDRELNKQYQLLLKGQPADLRQSITAAQRSWLRYRDDANAALALYYQRQQGSIWQLVAAEAKMNIIRDKATDLYRLRMSTDLSAEQDAQPVSKKD